MNLLPFGADTRATGTHFLSSGVTLLTKVVDRRIAEANRDIKSKTVARSALLDSPSPPSPHPKSTPREFKCSGDLKTKLQQNDAF